MMMMMGVFLPKKTWIYRYSQENPAMKERPPFPTIPISPAKPGVLIGFFQNFIFPNHDIISSLLSADGSNKCFLFFLGIQSRDGLWPWQELKFMAFRDIYFHFQGKAELHKHFSSRFFFTPIAVFPCCRNYEMSASRAKGKRRKRKNPFFLFSGKMCTINISLHIWKNIKHLHPGDSLGHKSWKGHKELFKDLVTAFSQEYYPILKICGNKSCGSTAGVSFTQETNFPDKSQNTGVDPWPVPIKVPTPVSPGWIRSGRAAGEAGLEIPG